MIAATRPSDAAVPPPSSTPSHRRAWLVVIGALALYAAGFAAFYPTVLTVNDETFYVRQAVALSEGTRDLHRPGSEMPFEHGRHMSEYPIGTSILAVPFVLAFGWRGAFVLAPLCLAAAVLLTARWLTEHGRSPAFALVVLGFVPALALGRIVMSDLPSTAVVALGLWLFFRGEARATDGSPVLEWVLAGFVASLSAFLRESNVLLFAPFFAGSLLRRRRGWWALLAGGLAGAALRPLAMWLLYDDPFFLKAAQPFALDSMLRNLPIYALALTVLVPGGLVAAALYRGARRPELVATVGIYFVFFVVYSYNASESGLVRGAILSLRFFLPLVPLLAFALAEVGPRWAARVLERLRPERATTARRIAHVAAVTCALGFGVVLVGVHVASAQWARSRAAIRAAIYERTLDGAVLLTNGVATGKYVNELYGPRILRDWQHVEPSRVPAVATEHEHVFLVYLDRDEGEFWRRTRREWSAWRARVVERCAVRQLYDEPTGAPGERLTIERVVSCAPPEAGH